MPLTNKVSSSSSSYVISNQNMLPSKQQTVVTVKFSLTFAQLVLCLPLNGSCAHFVHRVSAYVSRVYYRTHKTHIWISIECTIHTDG